jgi:pimeloyl-ACP methyl ester carboxylesterase
MLNAFPQFRTEIDGLGFHFLHVRSPHPNALPLVLTHGWPGSMIEFHKVIRPLTDPTAFGGDTADAFHLILPTLPGYGFSDKPRASGWNIERISRAWTDLVRRLGYDRWVAQGGDWGSSVTTTLGAQAPAGLIGIHVNALSVAYLGRNLEAIDDEEREAFLIDKRFRDFDSAYFRMQSGRPQTIGYALADTPVGQAAWIYEKFWSWADCNGDPESVLTRDEILDDITLYWLTNTATSSARLYWESARTSLKPIHIPFGYSIFRKEIGKVSRRWVAPLLSNIVHWNKLDRGGHFAAFEQPELFVDELRTCFRKLR